MQLETDGTLAGDDPWIVVCRDEGKASFLALPQGFGERAVVVIAAQDGLRAVLAYPRDFDQRRKHRHDDGCGDIEPMAVERQRHAVIAGAGGDHAAITFFSRQGEQAVEGTTLFEGTGHL